MRYPVDARDLITWSQLLVAVGANYNHINALLRWLCLIGTCGSVAYDSIIYISMKHERACRAEGICSESVQTYSQIEYTPSNMLDVFSVAYLVSCSLDVLMVLLLCLFLVHIGYCSSSRGRVDAE